MKIIIILTGLIYPLPAFAYLDPGTGSIILQGLIAGLAAAAVVMKTYWYKIKSFFGKSDAKTLADEESATVDADSDSKSWRGRSDRSRIDSG